MDERSERGEGVAGSTPQVATEEGRVRGSQTPSISERARWIEEQAKELKRLGIGGLARIHILPMLRDAMSFADRQREKRVEELIKRIEITNRVLRGIQKREEPFSVTSLSITACVVNNEKVLEQSGPLRQAKE